MGKKGKFLKKWIFKDRFIKKTDKKGEIKFFAEIFADTDNL